MKRSHNPFLTIFTSFCLFFLFIGEVRANNIRKPVWAGAFYPAARSELEKTIDRFTARAKKTHVQIPTHKALRALILPHAGYIYSGLTAAHASLVLKEKQFARVILIGPDHRVGFKNGAISDVEAYQTPIGLIKLDKDAEKLRLESDLFRYVPASDRSEHSLEVILPFLQRYLKEFEIIPIVLGQCNINRLASAIEPLVDQNTLLVVSSDLSHFLPYDEAVLKDKETVNMILNLEHEKLSNSYDRACGRAGISILLSIARRHGWEPVLLHYSNSGDTAGDRARVVGYAAIAFYGDSPGRTNNDSYMQFTQEQGRALVRLARKTIMEKLGQKMNKNDSDSLDLALADSVFQTRRGTFVTLKINGRLRGCIGNPGARESVLAGVRENALKAAFHDFRFRPLSDKELGRVDIEVSILTEPQPLEYLVSADLVARLRPNIDGVIIRKGSAGAIFLPQVWDQLPGPEEFLSHLCAKAGLSPNAWRNTRLDVLTYQVQYFEEKR